MKGCHSIEGSDAVREALWPKEHGALWQEGPGAPAPGRHSGRSDLSAPHRVQVRERLSVLGVAVMAVAVYAVELTNAVLVSGRESTDEFAPLKPKIDTSTKVTRYRAGQVPHFAVGYEEERGFVTASSQVRGATKSSEAASAKPSTRKRIEAQVITKKSSAAAPSSPPRRGSKSDRSQSEERGGKLSSDDEKTANALDDSSSEEEDEEAFNRRRQALRNKLLASEKNSVHETVSTASGSAVSADSQVTTQYCLRGSD